MSLSIWINTWEQVTAYEHFKNRKVPFVNEVYGKDPRKIPLLLNKSAFTEKIQDQATLQ
jgi:hypothetical protein